MISSLLISIYFSSCEGPWFYLMPLPTQEGGASSITLLSAPEYGGRENGQTDIQARTEEPILVSV
jgi:hypothetical protein